MAKLNEFLTVGSAAEYLGVSRDTLRRWDRSGRLPAQRHPMNGYRLYLKTALEAVRPRASVAQEPASTKERDAAPVDEKLILWAKLLRAARARIRAAKNPAMPREPQPSI